MNIDELEAGRETDALVAEHVMGWKIQRHPDGSITARDQAGRFQYFIWCERPCYPDYEPYWQPSTDWAAAGAVLEKLNSPDAHIKLETGTRDGESVWWCVFIIGDGRHDCAAGDTPQLAICRAALQVYNASQN